MDLNWNGIIIAMGAPPAGTQQDPRAMNLQFFGFLAIMIVVFYLVAIRPQRKQQREHAEKLKSLKSGDRILTTSGIVATVVTVKEKTLTIRSADTKLEITKAAVADITERAGASESSGS